MAIVRLPAATVALGLAVVLGLPACSGTTTTCDVLSDLASVDGRLADLTEGVADPDEGKVAEQFEEMVGLLERLSEDASPTIAEPAAVVLARAVPVDGVDPPSVGDTLGALAALFDYAEDRCGLPTRPERIVPDEDEEPVPADGERPLFGPVT